MYLQTVLLIVLSAGAAVLAEECPICASRKTLQDCDTRIRMEPCDFATSRCITYEEPHPEYPYYARKCNTERDVIYRAGSCAELGGCNLTSSANRWTGRGCFKESKNLRKRNLPTIYGVNRQNPDNEKVYSQCKEEADNMGYEIFGIRAYNKCATTKDGKMVDLNTMERSTSCSSDEQGYGAGVTSNKGNADNNFIYTKG